MAEGSAKIIIDADAAKLVAEAIKGGKAIEGMAKRTKSVGDQFTAAITKVELFKRAIMAAGRAIDETVSKATRLSRSGGATAMSIGTSLSSLGSTNISSATDQVMKFQGPWAADADSILSTIAANNEGARNKVSSADALRAAGEYAVLGPLALGPNGKDLTDNLKNGMSYDAAKAAALKKHPGFQGISSDAGGRIVEERGLRTMERDADVQTSDMNRTIGAQARRGAVDIQLQDVDPTKSSTQARELILDAGMRSTVELDRGKLPQSHRRFDSAAERTAAAVEKIMSNTRPAPALAPGAERSP